MATTDNQRLSILNFYQKYNGNEPFIITNKSGFDENSLKTLKTDVPYVADKIRDEKKEIWNEALTYLRYK